MMKAKSKYVFGTDWMVEAPCVGQTDLFFPNFDDEFPTETEAKAICGTCPFTARCLDYAMYMGDVEGVYGGLNGKERAKVRRRHNATWESLLDSLSPALDAVAEQYA
jgi:WhiB family redox-sensing transcriptional regulator